MSCFIVSNAHINALTHAYTRYDVRSVWYERQPRYLSEQQVGDILLTQNVRSYNERYGENAAETFVWNSFQRDFTPAEILKACACYDYQACETDDYYATLAHAIVEAIRYAAICALPGYEEAAWEITEDES